ncbi:MAG: chromosomal replication initiator protein DnaA [bacterium]
MSEVTLDKPFHEQREDLENIWNKTLKNLGDEMPHSKFEAWIRPIEPVSIEKKTLTIATNDTLSKEWISKNYKELIGETLKGVTGRKHNLEIILKKDANLTERKPFKVERQKSETVSIPVVEAKENKDEFQINALRSMSCNLNLKYTFDTFVVGENNKFAFNAALAVAKNPAQNHNPLFIYGGSGLGKTHLMQAIGHYILVNHPNLKVRYTNTEAFMNELVNSIRAGASSTAKMAEFRYKYRHVDVFLIDDIQFLESKKHTQDEIFHTFEYLYNSGKQIIITSDRPPKAIPTLTDRLRSRFEWGLLADVQAPDFETRSEILNQRAQREGIEVSNDVVGFIAKACQSNVRELEGALNRLMAYSSINNMPINLESAQSVLGVETFRPSLNIEKILEATGEFFGISKDDIKSPSKAKEISHARQVGVYLSRDLIKASFPSIGNCFGGRKHTTIMYSFEKVQTQMEKNMLLKEQVTDLSRLLAQKYSR